MSKFTLLIMVVCLSFGLVQAQEMIIDGTFDADTSAWIVEDEHGAVLLYEIVDGHAHLTVDNVGSDPWNNQFKQKLTLLKGKKYDVSFDMKAIPFVSTDIIGIGVWLQEDHPDFTLVDEKTFYPTAEWQTFSYTSEEWYLDDDDDAKFTFVFTETYIGDEVWIDNVSVSEEGTLVGINNDFANQPLKFSLSQNYPNPFNPTTTIHYSLPKRDFVNLKVCNCLGKELQTLISEFVDSGTHSVTFDASNLPSGLYFYKLQAGDLVEIRKMIVMK